MVLPKAYGIERGWPLGGGQAGSAPTPAPTPAPVFTVAPSISPGSGTANSTLFTANDGTSTNTTSKTRRWLLSGSAIGTGTTVTPATAGSLVLEVTANGPGGSAVATSDSVTVAAPTPTPSAPPEDWRMPATFTRSSGGDVTGLNAAHASASSKTRPAITVASSTTDTVSIAVGAFSTPLLLSWLGQDANGSVTVDGVAYTVKAPSGGTIQGANGNNRRQGLLIPAGGARTIAVAFTSGATAQTIKLLVHKLPASGPWLAFMVFDASRPDQGFGSEQFEASIIAENAAWDAVVFNYARSSFTVGNLAGIVNDAVAAWGGIASAAIWESMIGNDISGSKPWTSGQTVGLTASLTTIANALEGAGMAILPSNASYRQGSPSYTTVTPTSQAGGALEYNDNVLHPFIASRFPDFYDAALLRPKSDTYLQTLYDRANLSDDVHGTATQYTNERAMRVQTDIKRFITGAWSYTSQIEQRVAAAETASTNKATALTVYTEATYARDALAASSAKTAFSARLSAIYPTVLFYDAVRLIDVADGSKTQGDKDTAQAALNAASAAGYAGGTPPNTIAAQQARIDAIIVSTVLRTFLIRFGSTTVDPGWNGFATATPATTPLPNMIDSTGTASTVNLNYTPASVNLTAGGPVTAVTLDWLPAAMSTMYCNRASASFPLSVSGLDNSKKYDIEIFCRRDGALKTVKWTIGGVEGATFDTNGNTGNTSRVNGITPSSGTITIAGAIVSGTSNFPINAMRVIEKSA